MFAIFFIFSLFCFHSLVAFFSDVDFKEDQLIKILTFSTYIEIAPSSGCILWALVVKAAKEKMLKQMRHLCVKKNGILENPL